MGAISGFLSLFANKDGAKAPGETQEGTITDLLPELDLKITDDELLSLKKKWESAWTTYYQEIEKSQNENERYWLGKQYMDVQAATNQRPLIDNRIFSSLETFLPIATRQNPEPLVTANNTEDGEELADKVTKVLAYQTDIQRLRLKLKKVTRFWALYYLGVAKVGWDKTEDDIKTVVIRPQKLILDPSSTIDEDGYTGEYIGEYREDQAKTLVVRFPGKKDLFEKKVDGNMDTKIRYLEWWTDEYVFWTLEENVLGKAKNPHWNYPQEDKRMDEFGVEQVTNTDGKNHFSAPKKPYVFLSVFNIGLHPLDDTSLIVQSLPLQDLVNKRMRQTDKNVDGMNGGAVVSGDHFSMEEAAQVSEALRKGATVWVPNGDINAAYRRDQGMPLPTDVFNQLIDARQAIDTAFGTHGTTRGEKSGPETASGRIILKGSDESRIGFISDYLEQFTDQIYNWWVQLMCVYYDEPHVAVIIGEDKAKEYIDLQKEEFNSKLLISVREGSLIPKDPLIKRNEALDLWNAKAIDPIELFKRLDFPNPSEAAKQLWLWNNTPEVLFGEAPAAPAAPAAAQPTGAPAPAVAPTIAPNPEQAILADVKDQMAAIAQQTRA